MLAVSVLVLALLPQAFAIAGPACARKHYGTEECVSKCRSNWGSGSHVMGNHRWGHVMSSTSLSPDSVVSRACGISSGTPQGSLNSPSSVYSQTSTIITVTEPLSSSTLIAAPSSVNTVSSVSSAISSPVSPPSSSSKPEPSSTPIVHSSSSVRPPPQSSSSSPVPSSTPEHTSSSSVVSKPSSSPHPSSSSTPSTSSSASVPSKSPSNSGTGKTATGGSTSSSDIDAYLTTHNTVRAQHGAKDLAWNDDLAVAAQKWASGCVFKHSGGSLGPFGENLAAGTGDFTIQDGVKAWADEAPQYDASNPQPSHFTQMVWKASTEVGCALVSCPGGSIFDASFGAANYVVCEYSPAGNVIGEFPQNVQA